MLGDYEEENIDQSISFYDFYRKQDIEVGFFMVKQVDDNLKPTNSQLRELMEYVYLKEGNVTKVFDIINFADNMMFDQTGFPIAHCGAGINALSIDPNGDVFPCVKISKHNKKITNLLREDALADIIKNRNMIINTDLIFMKQQCARCDIKYFCGGGCRAEENENMPCEYNCNYFKLALQFFSEKKILERCR